MSILTKIFGDANEKYLKTIQPIVDKVNSLEPTFEGLSNLELKEKTKEFKERLVKGESLDNVLPEAFALVREAAKRTLQERHHNVQLIGGIALHQKKIAQMQNGEGKTLTATLPLYLNALEGKGVHLVTVNDYLARRDAVWMGQIFHLLGLSAGCINHERAFLYDPEYKKAEEEKDEIRDELGSFLVVEDFLRPVSRKQAYESDITYGTNNEFGFDYLRDNLVFSLQQRVQRTLNFVIVDEIDSILIDEARTPLIISAPDVEAGNLYRQFSKIMPSLTEGDYEIDEKLRVAVLTEQGIEKIERILGVDNIYAEKGIELLHYLEQSLRGYFLFKRDRDYVVHPVRDSGSGRGAQREQISNGVKNGEIIIVDEFTGRLMPGRRYSGGLHQAIEAKERVQVRPESRTLATISFQNFFRLYDKLSGMTGTALNSAEEFEKVYGLHVVDIPTNVPVIRKDLADKVFKTKRGKFKTLIEEVEKSYAKKQPVLVGTRSIEKNEELSSLLKRAGIPHQVLNAKNHEREAQIIAQAGQLGAVTVATNMAGRGVNIILGGNPPDPIQEKKVRELGGLKVLGTERHESRRIDNQLRGRAGRQGAPGQSQFFLSLEDELLRIFGGERILALMERLKIPETEPIEAGLISKAVRQAQAKIEGLHFDARRHLLEYDDVVNKHRQAFYKKREEVLRFSASGLRSEILEILKKTRENVKDYELKEQEIGIEKMRQIEKTFFLQIMDFFWQEHLEIMESLRESVRLRAYGGQDPLVAYKSEGYRLFGELFDRAEGALAQTLSKIKVLSH